MSQQKSSKYTAFPPVGLVDRQWPNNTITQARLTSKRFNSMTQPLQQRRVMTDDQQANVMLPRKI